ncbi:hypothetical protein CW751_04900 [Brumimicrobium salinarum]|uniref:Fibronectin type-III domain-containing protein n=1 Tax=Brumimicrobium salinarum TaxID=2058658 RepID=A0A2I0R496_9FLAO|nr:gliding motility-associated C-terminal domain-containing protein [Brumimicrobium salinarum]PKR81398.1 hypothetical protein CW751_04900 [Brumimicrobium salinarum]
MFKKILFLLLLITGFCLPNSYATHSMGGEITWSCQGSGDYIFELVFYRDCNGFEVDANFETIDVWGHPTLNSIQVDFVSRTDISPNCTAAAGNTPFDCGTGVSGGNGIGAIEKVTYRSAPITIIGVPPNEGWHFTFQNFSRSGALTNIQNPTSYGITLTASMFPIQGATGGCIDNSPTFLQSPYFVSCTGDDYDYNPNAVDTDLDSLHFRWGKPLDYFPSGIYTPPTSPAPVLFEPGFSFDNPTPDANINANNQAATLNDENGRIQFKSFTQGNFIVKVMVDAYRNGQKIATVEREMQFIVASCSGNNNAPTVTPPFAGGTSFETEIFAGDAINFQIDATDTDLLQDGNPQSITITPSGLIYGNGFSDPNNGCIITPCATLDNPSITAINNATLEFDWQTSCNHLVDATGSARSTVPYVFVFKIEDDYCPIPKVRYATVVITLKNKDVLPAPEITCITTDASGNATVNWTSITDPFGTFDGYEINTVNGGLIQTENNINSTSITTSVGSQQQFYINTLSGCDGLTKSSSDTISNIFLDLNNPGTGEAILQWNQPYSSQKTAYHDDFYIYREFPVGTWTLIDSVPYSTTTYKDTISVCQETLGYQIVLKTSNCDFSSNQVSDVFEDKIVPDIPLITSVDIDTLNSNITVSWDENRQEDTYGYVVYQTDPNGNLVEIDTVWGRPNTSYTHFQNPSEGPYEYSIAAFDSCYTSNIPPTYQTSAKANPHTTNFLSSSIDVCARLAKFEWSGYIGFDEIEEHLLFIKKNGSAWTQGGQTNTNDISIDIQPGDQIVAVVQSISKNGETAFSNMDTLEFAGETGPEMSYLSVATVREDEVLIKHNISYGEGGDFVQLERFNQRSSTFEKIDEKPVNNTEVVKFIDADVETDKYSYTYRTKVIDTCNQALGYSNQGRTILLNVITNEEREVHVLQWSGYEDFIGNINNYTLYRSIDGSFDTAPIATLPHNVRTYTDSVSNIGTYDDGKICYLVVANEASNAYGMEERSYSNIVCGVIQPKVFIPNAFTVGGHNPIFKPETSQHQVTDYLFEVYDRYGRVIFETQNPNEGWNGQLKGQKRIAREGVYVYRLSMRNGEGIAIIKHGHVTLLDYRSVD